MLIEVLGKGCVKCEKTKERIKKAIDKKQIEAEVVAVTDITAIVNRGVMVTPAVIIDGETVLEGKVPSEDEIDSWLKQ